MNLALILFSSRRKFSLIATMKKKYPQSCCKSHVGYFREYCRATGIHGFQYLGEKRSCFERIWWLIVFLITLLACSYAIWEVYQKWVKSPVIVTFATQETPIYMIPFPAVTICPQSKISQKTYNHSRIIEKIINKENFTSKEQHLLDYIGLICSKNFHLQRAKRTFIDSNIYELLMNFTYIFPFSSCKYMGLKISCKKIFTPIVTDEGICFSFNILDRSEIFANIVHQNLNFHKTNISNNEWTVENGYSDSSKMQTYPRRANLAGVSNSLEVTLIKNYNNYDVHCRTGVQGYKVVLHLPSRVPRPSQHFFLVPENQIVAATVSPEMIRTADSLTNYDVETRNCYLSNERILKYFKLYTVRNCKFECLTNFTLYYCGCVGFFMPRENETKICGMKMYDCMANAEKELHNLNLPDIPKNRTKKHKMFGNFSACDCLNMCSDLSYNVRLSQTKWAWQEIYKVYKLEQRIKFKSASKLLIFFETSNFIYSERHELYGPLDFLANFGGLLGLFTGFSLLSLMEIIYFLSLRIICNLKLYGNWAGKEN